jgi:acetylornithine/succinyldiaminopimelate/putrescine aminotransferase
MLNHRLQKVEGPGTGHFDGPQEEKTFALAEGSTTASRRLYDILYGSIVSDPKSSPEKINATFERIQEVAGLVIDNAAPAINAICADAPHLLSQPRQPVGDQLAHVVVEALLRTAGPDQIIQMARLLNDSEISAAEAIDLHEEFKIPVSRLEKDIIPVKAKGVWLRAVDGKTYLDMDSNYSATNLGSDNPEIALGLFNQAMRLISMKEDRVHIARARFLKTFQGMLPEELSQFYWQNSGGEAVDKSLKLAKAYTHTTGVVAFTGGFHGRTHGAVAVTHNLKYREPFGLDKLDWVHFAEYNDADAVKALFAQGKAKIVIVELVQGEEAGIRPGDPSFVQSLRKTCDEYGGVLICDEVQTGFGRTAEKEGQWFACQGYGIVPDIITIGKSFGGGYPVTAVVTKKEISKAMHPGYDGSTFGGNPMAMVAATIATRQMRSLNLTRNVVARSAQIMQGLAGLRENLPMIRTIRGKGLMIAFELPSADHVARFQEEMAMNGVLTSLSTGPYVRLLPPLIISESEADFLLSATECSLRAIA